MADETQKLLALLREAQSLAEAHFGVSNILQPGIIKEIMMAGVLGHKVVANKGLHDAEDLQGRKYEYLASINRRNVRTNRGASFQIDRITEDNLTRVTRNAAFYFGFFEDHLNLEKIIRVETEDILKEVQRQRASSKNTISHVNFLGRWVAENGTTVYEM